MVAKNPKGTSIIFVGGPRDDETFKYPTPLPRQLVFQYPGTGKSVEVYYRKPNSCTYIHESKVPDPKIRKQLGLG